jgi:hypothetical protein
MYTFIDVEASGLGVGSYPIEVGVAMADTSMHCTLIRPDDDWIHWDNQAEDLHGITREILLVNGKSILKVAMLLNEWLDGQTVYSDAWGNDSCWLGLLFERASLQQRFKIDSVVSLLSQEQMALWHSKKLEVTKKMDLKRHRASSDALILQKTLLEL